MNTVGLLLSLRVFFFCCGICSEAQELLLIELRHSDDQLRLYYDLGRYGDDSLLAFQEVYQAAPFTFGENERKRSYLSDHYHDILRDIRTKLPRQPSSKPSQQRRGRGSARPAPKSNKKAKSNPLAGLDTVTHHKGQEICRQWNGGECKFTARKGGCQMVHVCAIRGCGLAHRAISHPVG